MFRTALLALFALTATLTAPVDAAPVPKDREKPKENPELTAMKGEWKLTGIMFNGQSIKADNLDITWDIQGESAVVIDHSNKRRTTMKLKIDSDTKTRRLTFTDAKQTDLEGKPLETGVSPTAPSVIYTLEGDTLEIKPEMTADKSGVNTPNVSTTFTRVKK